ncbi:hypothetical protein JOQ06_016978 [Pogonophryne albipinna]|uniref:Uncharacterized protein n=1 Tax=Pogonophryne albipinna TaxID=1090488 RepID=A0AAD6B3C1_9TELE|nr:hypothetical protein JOQ06_016978 [Pogonophryne albipinna]
MVISQMKERFRLDFDGRYTYLQDLLHYASALDPRFKDLAFLGDNETKDMIFMKITAEVVKMDGLAGDGDTLIEDQAAETEGDRSPHREEEETDDVPPMKKTALDQMFGDFLPARSSVKKTTKERAKEEILKYRERSLAGTVDSRPFIYIRHHQPQEHFISHQCVLNKVTLLLKRRVFVKQDSTAP